MCIDFNATLYDRLHTAYRLLGKTQTSMDQLHMHVTSAVHNTAWNVVYGHAVLGGSADAEADLAKRPYADLCAQVAPASILPCLVDMCRALWGIMSSYRKIARWHLERGGSDGEESKEDELERQYVERKLESGRRRVWQDVQAKARVFVLANDLSGFGIDAFLEFMDVIRRLIAVGRSFCGVHSAQDTLQESLKKQCWSYFHSYHLARLEELQMHLENEGWARCPARSTFSARQLAEYRHLRQPPPTMSPAKKPAVSSSLELSPFDPSYDYSPDDDEEEGVGDSGVSASNGESEEGFCSGDDVDDGGEDSDEGISEELRRDYVDEDQIVATNSAENTNRRQEKRYLLFVTLLP